MMLACKQSDAPYLPIYGIRQRSGSPEGAGLLKAD